MPFNLEMLDYDIDHPAIYEFGDAEQNVVYTGSADRLKARLLQHMNDECIKTDAVFYRFVYRKEDAESLAQRRLVAYRYWCVCEMALHRTAVVDKTGKPPIFGRQLRAAASGLRKLNCKVILVTHHYLTYTNACHFVMCDDQVSRSDCAASVSEPGAVLEGGRRVRSRGKVRLDSRFVLADLDGWGCPVLLDAVRAARERDNRPAERVRGRGDAGAHGAGGLAELYARRRPAGAEAERRGRVAPRRRRRRDGRRHGRRRRARQSTWVSPTNARTRVRLASTQHCGRSQKRRLRRRREFNTTEIDDAVIAKAANIGLMRMPKKGKSNPAATGTPEAL